MPALVSIETIKKSKANLKTPGRFFSPRDNACYIICVKHIKFDSIFSISGLVNIMYYDIFLLNNT